MALEGKQMSAERRAQIDENAQAPRRIKGDEAEVEEHSLTEQIAADRYLSSATAVDASGSRGVRLSVFKPPGAV